MRVTAANSAGSTTADSTQTQVVTVDECLAAGQHLAAGDQRPAQQGQTLSASAGSWSNSPTSFGYQWRRCSSSGSSCADIPSATSRATPSRQPTSAHAPHARHRSEQRRQRDRRLDADAGRHCGRRRRRRWRRRRRRVGRRRGGSDELGRAHDHRPRPPRRDAERVDRQLERQPDRLLLPVVAMRPDRLELCPDRRSRPRAPTRCEGRRRLDAARVGDRHNAGGAGSAMSAPTAEVSALAPTMLARPVIRGTLRVGKTLVAGGDRWTEALTRRSYTWLRCGPRAAAASRSRARGRARTSSAPPTSPCDPRRRDGLESGGSTKSVSLATAPVRR